MMRPAKRTRVRPWLALTVCCGCTPRPGVAPPSSSVPSPRVEAREHAKADRDRLAGILGRNPTKASDGWGPAPEPHEPLSGKPVRLAGVVREIHPRDEGRYSISLTAPAVDSTTHVDCIVASRPLVRGSMATVEGVLRVVVKKARPPGAGIPLIEPHRLLFDLEGCKVSLGQWRTFGASAKAMGVHPAPLPEAFVPNQWLTFEAPLGSYAADERLMRFQLPHIDFDCATATPGLELHAGERLVVHARVPAPDEKVSATLADCQPLDP